MKASIAIPDLNNLDRFLEDINHKSYSYREVGASKKDSVSGYDNDHSSILLGNGEAVWEKAKKVLRTWQHFPLPWTKIYPNTTKLKEGNIVVVLFKVFGLWWTNSAKIVYQFDEKNRFGFAYGTLPDHIECGEECFWIERDKSGDIYYHIKAFSKPAVWYVRLGYPVARMFQKKFVRESMQTMKELANTTIA